MHNKTSLKRTNRFKTFVLAILTSIVFELFLKVITLIWTGKSYELFANGAFIYFSLIALVVYIYYRRNKKRIDFSYLVFQRFLFAILIALISFILHNSSSRENLSTNMTSYHGGILMMDDMEFIEYADQGGYSSNYELFLPVGNFIDGIFIKDGDLYEFKGNQVFIKKLNGEEFFLRTRKVKYWQYAYCKGYKPLLQMHNPASTGLLYTLINVTPMYFLEILINAGVKGIVFAFYILVLVSVGKDKVTLRQKT